jgi:threonine dehydrogenase-like Zn-dependent dehydrogenase
VRETPDPVPGPGELLVRTLSTAICASDIHYMDHPETVVDDPAGLFAYDPDRDIVMGHEFVGEVVAHGPDCSNQFPAGTRVTSTPILLRDGRTLVIGQHPDAPGSFGELFLVTESMARAVPDGVPLDAVAVVDAFAVGEGYVALSHVAPPSIPLVVGAGAIGLSAVAALASREIEPIIVADFNPGRLELAGGFGAHVLVNPADRSPFEVWGEVAAARLVDAPPVIFECVGAGGLIQQIVESCHAGSRIFAAGGWYTGDTLNCTDATRKGVSIQFGGAPGGDAWYGTLAAVCEGRLDPMPAVGMVVGLEDVPNAIDLARKAEGPPRIVVHM